MGSWYIYLHEWLFLMVKHGFHVGKYTSPMDGKGMLPILNQMAGKIFEKKCSIQKRTL